MDSPMGAALLGKRVGNEVTVQRPQGEVRLTMGMTTRASEPARDPRGLGTGRLGCCRIPRMNCAGRRWNDAVFRAIRFDSFPQPAQIRVQRGRVAWQSGTATTESRHSHYCKAEQSRGIAEQPLLHRAGRGS
jgi:hypothetical protein